MGSGLSLLVALLSLSPSSGGLGALGRQETPAYSVESWKTDQGLPQNSATAVLQARDGYLWVGTFGGLGRFDGVRFQVFDISNTAELGNNRILSLHEDAQGALWIGTQDAGVSRYADGVFEHFGEDEGAPPGEVWAIAEDRDGVLWFGGQGLTRRVGERFEQVLPETLDLQTHCILVEDAGTLWLATDLGVLHYVRGSVRTYTTADGLPDGPCFWVDHDATGNLWASTLAGLAVLRGESFELAQLPEGTAPGIVHAGLIAADGTRWIGGDGLFRLGSFEGERPLEPLSLPALADISVRSLTEDREGNLWIGTNGDGLLRCRSAPFSVLNTRRGIHGAPTAIRRGPAGDEVWIGLSDGVILRHSDDGVRPAANSLSEAFSGPGACLHIDGNGEPVVFDSRFVTRFRDGRVSERFEHGLEQVLDPFVEDSGGTIWFGTRDAVASLHGTEITTTPLPPDRRGPVRVHAGEKGHLWASTSDGIGRVVEGAIEFLPVPVDSFPKGAIRAIREDGETLWFTTYGSGLGHYADGTLTMLTEADGLPDNSLGGLQADDDDHFWINSNHGVFRVSDAELEDRLAGRTRTISCQLLRTGEGNGGSSCRTSDGRIWFPTLEGVAIVDPEHVKPNLIAPQVAIERIQAGNEMYEVGTKVTIPPGNNDLVIEYTGLSFVDPDSVRFQYRLVGYEEQWIEVGSRRRAYYTNIPPGSYLFEVVACNDDGMWNEVGAATTIQLLPFFYQTSWFIALGLAATFFVLFGFYQARTRAIRRRNVALRTEIQERERAQVALRESEERYRVVAEAATDAILTIDEQGKIVYANPAAKRVFGRAPADCVGLPLDTLLPGPSEGEQDFDSSDLWEGRELVGYHRDGHAFPVEVSLGVARQQHGRPRITCIVRDITERRRTEEERARLEERLRESKKMEAMGRLAGGISHDFNNILTAMLSHAEMLDERIRGGRSDGTLEHVAEIQKCTELAFSLTNQLLAFSRRQVVQTTLLEPSEVLGRIEPMLRRLIREDIDLIVEASEDAGPIRADVGQLEQVIMNLVLNGSDAMPNGGRLTVQTAAVELDEIYAACNSQASVGPHVLIAVSDTGVGIREDALPHLFEPFFTTKSVGQGTGLGLASVHGIVQQSGGHITVTSEPGRGTTFRVYLPRGVRSTDRDEVPRGEASGADVLEGAETVLVCDDYAAVRRATQMILSNHGYRVLSADGPEEALRIAREHPTPIHLLITDVVMPGMNGPQLSRQVRALQPDVRVLFVSGYTSDIVIHEGAEPDGTGFLQKPFVFKELLGRIRELLDSPVRA